MSKTITSKQVWSYITSNIKPFPTSLFVLFFTAFISGVDLSFRPYLLKVILNRLTTGSQAEIFSYLSIPIALYLSLYFFTLIFHRLFDYFIEIKMIPQLRTNIANGAMSLLMDKSHTYYQHHFSGSLASKINDLTSCIPAIIQASLYQFSLHSLSLMVAIGTLWQANALFALFMFIWSILFFGVAWFLSKRLTKLSRHWSEFGSIITGKLVDILSNILAVRLFTGKKQEKISLNETFEAAVDAEQKMQWGYCLMWLFYSGSFLILQIVNFYFLCKGRQEGWITIGDFALVLVINIAIVHSIWQVATEFSQFSKLYGRIAQALQVILEKPELEDRPDAKTLIVSKGEICFSNVKFHYKGAQALFENKSVIIQPGQKVGLVGYSGSGKSTFINLILRLYDVTEGAIFIDGQNIQEVTQDSLRQFIAMIPQDPSLFHRSLMDNIRYGQTQASDEKVIDAAKHAHADEFISKLPQGYESLVGERGVKLSGGQRQRIAIARAILKNAPILMLDEATSQLDSLTESYIQESLWHLMENKTTLVIAHRLSTLLHMDRILVFEQGKIVEDGTHEALLAQNGRYKTLWEAQVGGFLLDKEE